MCYRQIKEFRMFINEVNIIPAADKEIVRKNVDKESDIRLNAANAGILLRHESSSVRRRHE